MAPPPQKLRQTTSSFRAFHTYPVGVQSVEEGYHVIRQVRASVSYFETNALTYIDLDPVS